MALIDVIADVATEILGDTFAPYALIASTQRDDGTLLFDTKVHVVHSNDSPPQRVRSRS